MDGEMELVTKIKIQQGVKATMDVSTSIGIFRIRQLRRSEKNVANLLMLKSLPKAKTKEQFEEKIIEDPSTLLANQNAYTSYVVSRALSLQEDGAEVWTEDDVDNLTIPENDFNLLVSTIENYNGWKNGGASKNAAEFRGNAGGEKPIDTPPLGSAASV